MVAVAVRCGRQPGGKVGTQTHRAPELPPHSWRMGMQGAAQPTEQTTELADTSAANLPAGVGCG
jgi:hypothetical protein